LDVEHGGRVDDDPCRFLEVLGQLQLVARLHLNFEMKAESLQSIKIDFDTLRPQISQDSTKQ
jgi:hypothetical protein